MTRRIKRLLSILVGSVLGFAAMGCNEPQIRIIDKIEFSVSPNLEYIELLVKFDRSISSPIQGSFPVQKYGDIFVNPTTSTTPFEVGFRLDTAIFNEQDYVNIDPTTVLPNGVNLPLQVDRALVQLSGETPLHPEFDLYGYVDILGREWLGLAGIFKFINQTFPAGLSIAQDFFKDAAGRAGAVVAVFGPKVRNGQLETPGGLAVFGNVSRLIEVARMRTPNAPGNKYMERGNPAHNRRIIQIYRDRAMRVVPLPSDDDF